MKNVKLRIATRSGVWLAQQAKAMAAALSRGAVFGVSRRLVDGFLLIAQRNKARYTATVLDLPTFLLMRTEFGDSVQLAGPQINGRDVVSRPAPGVTPEFAPLTVGKPAEEHVGYPVPNSLGWLFRPTVSYGATTQFRYLLSRTGLAPVYGVSTPDPNPDDMAVLTPATPVYAVTQLFSPFCLGIVQDVSPDGVVSVARRGLYLQSVNLRPDESDLPSTWKFLPRRRVSHTAYKPTDPYAQLDSSFLGPTGGHYGDAQTPATSGSDVLCVAARVFKQWPDTWLDYAPDDDVEDPLATKYTYYDRQGEQALAIVRGAVDRSLYDPINGSQFLVSVGDVHLVMPTDLPMVELHPLPVLRLPSYGGRPAIPNFGSFLGPHTARTSSGFVTFSLYTTRRDTNAYPPGWLERAPVNPEFPHGTQVPDTAIIGQAYALVVSTQLSSEVLQADWDSSDLALDSSGNRTIPVPLIPTAVPEILTLPWVVGATSVPLDDSTTPRVDVAYALVWEHQYTRRNWIQDIIGYNDIVRGSGGQLVLYRSDFTTVTRQVVTAAYAPLFAARMQMSPDTFGLNKHVPARNNNLSHVQYAGSARLVTAVVDTPVTVPAEDGTIAEHPIKCALISAPGAGIDVRGTITTRDNADVLCYISVVQLAKDLGGPSAEPAVFLAGVYDPRIESEGSGKTYISYDTGDTWAELAEDYAGVNGVFYLGNTLWRFDNSRPLSIGADR